MLQTLIIIFNLFILESLLSVDNAAVLAVMVKDLPKNDQKHALRWGLWGAYILRGACLFMASWLVQVEWLKIAGGLYLLYLVYGHFSASVQTIEEEDAPNWAKKIKNYFTGKIGILWSTIILVEIMDLAFSIDNVFAAVALSNNFYVIMIGVAIGILAMRFVAGWFVNLLHKHPSLEQSAFVVIALLGLKLILSGLTYYMPVLSGLKPVLESHVTDLIFSACMMAIFFLPLIFRSKDSGNNGDDDPIINDDEHITILGEETSIPAHPGMVMG